MPEGCDKDGMSLKIKHCFFIIISILLIGCNNTDISNLIESINIDIHNLENADTPGFKNTEQLQFTQGTLFQTENFTDIGINGSGSFKFLDETLNQIYFSRNGVLKINSEMFIVNSNGHYLYPKIQLNDKCVLSTLKINKNGKMEYSTFDNMNITELIKIYDENTNLELSNDKFQLVQGFLESSTVDIFERLLSIRFRLGELQNKRPNDKNIEAKIYTVEFLINEYPNLRSYNINKNLNNISITSDFSFKDSISLNENYFSSQQNPINDYLDLLKVSLRFITFDEE